MTNTRFWWVRHAPALRAKGMMAGRLDYECDIGATALAGLAACLPRHALWFVSPLRRTHDTARALQGVGRPFRFEIEADLVEQDFGAWEGRYYADLEADSRYRAFWSDPANTAPPDGESFAEASARMARGILSLARRCGGQDVVVIAHAGTIRAALGLALELTPKAMLRLAIDPLSLTRIDAFHPAEWAVLSVNQPAPPNKSPGEPRG